MKKMFIKITFLNIGLLILSLGFAKTAFSLIKEVVVVKSGSKEVKSLRWSPFEFSDADSSWQRTLGRVILSERSFQAKFESKSPYCRQEDGYLVGYTDRSTTRCEFTSSSGERQAYQLTMKLKKFEVSVDESCEPYSINLEKDIEQKQKSDIESTVGYLYVSCKESVSKALEITVDHSDNFNLRRSQIHERSGKNQNFKVYSFEGFGALIDKGSPILNTFTLISKKNTLEQSFNVKRSSSKLIKKAPIALDAGAGLSQVSYSGDDGNFSTISIRGIVSLVYLPYKKLVTRIDTSADIYALDDSNTTNSGNAYFFYDTELLVGWRFGQVHQVEALLGLSFSKYSYSLGSERRLFTRQGPMFKLIYRRLYGEKLKYWAQVQSHQYEAGNSVLKARFNYKWNTDSRFAAWLGLETQSFTDTSRSTGLELNDSGQSISIGAQINY